MYFYMAPTSGHSLPFVAWRSELLRFPLAIKMQYQKKQLHLFQKIKPEGWTLHQKLDLIGCLDCSGEIFRRIKRFGDAAFCHKNECLKVTDSTVESVIGDRKCWNASPSNKQHKMY